MGGPFIFQKKMTSPWGVLQRDLDSAVVIYLGSMEKLSYNLTHLLNQKLTLQSILTGHAHLLDNHTSSTIDIEVLMAELTDKVKELQERLVDRQYISGILSKIQAEAKKYKARSVLLKRDCPNTIDALIERKPILLDEAFAHITAACAIALAMDWSVSPERGELALSKSKHAESLIRMLQREYDAILSDL